MHESQFYLKTPFDLDKGQGYWWVGVSPTRRVYLTQPMAEFCNRHAPGVFLLRYDDAYDPMAVFQAGPAVETESQEPAKPEEPKPLELEVDHGSWDFTSAAGSSNLGRFEVAIKVKNHPAYDRLVYTMWPWDDDQRDLLQWGRGGVEVSRTEHPVPDDVRTRALDLISKALGERLTGKEV